MWKNLLPQGTRTVELCSGYALTLSAVLLILQVLPVMPELKLLDASMPWSMVLLIFGVLQVYSIYSYPKLELLRTLMSWISGCTWLWLALVSAEGAYDIEDISTLFLGISNLYGFIINFNLLHITWTE